MKLDEKGRCCGRKPVDYKGGAWNSPLHPEKFCTRCNRAYDRVTGEQIDNWAHWKCPACGGWISITDSVCLGYTCEQDAAP